uniref:1-alkyl-2-acetylglycerophosphocholine esterase n=1 Tax=Ditylenchus dipsaci TaxID=166011 RepID=A0A915DVS9_9BILA
MGLTYSSFSTSAQLPLLGDGEYLDFLPFCQKQDFNEDVSEEVIEYPTWRPRKEYLDGLAGYRQMSPRKMHFFFDWIVGERRLAAGWHTPLYSSLSSRSKTSENIATDISNRQISNGIDKTKPVEHDTKYPIAIFSHGISGNRLCYTTFCSSLASYGFVVAALEHRDKSSSWTYHLELDSNGVLVENPVLMDTFPDGESEFNERNIQLHHRVAECKKAVRMFEDLNLGKCAKFSDGPELQGDKIVHGHEFDWSQFKGRLDTSKASVIGHSFGGAAALASSALSSDFTASVCLDGWLYPIEDTLYSQVDRPVLMLNASKWQWKENVRRMLMINSLPSEKIMLTFKDIVHQTFSDFSFLMPGYMGKKMNLQGELDPNFTGHAIIEIVVTFLRNCFQSGKAANDIRQLLAKYDSNFVFEGTDLNLEEQKNKETSQTSNI